MRRYAFFVALLLVTSVMTALVGGTSENPEYWVKAYGSGYADEAKAVEVTPDGDIIVAGNTKTSRKSDAWIMRLDKYGNIVWSKTYGGDEGDTIQEALVTPNGNIVLVGATGSFERSTPGKMWILCLDEDGNVIWSRIYIGQIGDEWVSIGEDVFLTPDGKMIVVGSLWKSAIVLYLDENGEIIWSRVYRVNGTLKIRGVTALSNGNIVVVGYKFAYNSGYHRTESYDAVIMCLDKYGNVIWSKTYGGDKADEMRDVIVTSTGDLIVVGHTTSFGELGKSINKGWLLCFDKEGNLKWSKIYSGGLNPKLRKVVEIQNGDIIAVGTADDSSATNSQDMWAMKLDKDGNIIWSKTYGTQRPELAEDVDILGESIIVVGKSLGFEFGTEVSNILLARIPSDGNISWRGHFDLETHVKLLEPPSYDLKIISESCNLTSFLVTPDVQNFTPTTGMWYPKEYSIVTTNIKIKPKSLRSAVYWVRVYGNNATDEASAITTASNEDIIVVGSTNSYGFGRLDAWVMRLDKYGNVVWSKTYGGNESDILTAVTTTKNEEILVAGYTMGFDHGNKGTWVMKLDKDGNIIWSIKVDVGDSIYAFVSCIVALSNGNILVGMTIMSASYYYDNDAVILCLDNNGNLVWVKRFGGAYNQHVMAIKETSDGNVIALFYYWTGYTTTTESGIILTCLDYNGNIIWSKTYKSKDKIRYISTDIFETPDNCIIITGDAYTSYEESRRTVSRSDLWAMKLDKDGNIIWSKTYGEVNAYEIFRDSYITSDGNIVLIGTTSSVAGERDLWVLLVNESGDVVWSKVCGRNGWEDEAGDVILSPNGNIIVAGTTNSYGPKKENIIILCLPQNGSIFWSEWRDYYNITIKERGPIANTSSVNITSWNVSLETIMPGVLDITPLVETLYFEEVSLPSSQDTIRMLVAISTITIAVVAAIAIFIRRKR